jgi:hypothetical protein
VDLVARGKLPRGTEANGSVRVLYANSLDVRWRRSPKPKAGQGGLWLLHKTTGDRAELAPFELMHAIDVQPSLQLDLLRERGIAAGASEGDESA